MPTTPRRCRTAGQPSGQQARQTASQHTGQHADRTTVPIVVRLAVLLTGLAAVLVLAAPGTANARPRPADAIALNGSHFTVNAGNCRGVVKAVVLTNRARPGRATFKLTPGHFSRRCTVRPWVAWDFVSPNRFRVPLYVGPHGGKSITRTFRIGAGPHAFSAGHRSSLTAVTYYGLVP